jgi:large subunit ribosomal protein L19
MPEVTEEKNESRPEIKPGMTVQIHQKIKEITPKGEEKERIQIFEGIVLSKKGGKGISATITVRKISDGVGVEKIFPLHLPSIVKIEPIKKIKAKRAKLYYLRNYGKRLKEVPV